MSRAVLRLGTRASALATSQSGWVADRLRAAGHDVELVLVRTEGDVSRRSLTEIGGTGVFASALRDALREGRIDLAVHSLKDLPTAPEPGLVVAAVPEREDPRDVLVAREALTLAQLPAGAVVGTGSPRRAAQLRAARPDLQVRDIRGNVDTRIRLVRDGQVDAVLLARAGLARLDRLDDATDTLDLATMLPAAGQGALAVECREDDPDLVTLLRGTLEHAPTRAAVTAERTVLAVLEAGCTAPVAALATTPATSATPTQDGDPSLSLHVFVALHERAQRHDATGSSTEPVALGRAVAQHLLTRPDPAGNDADGSRHPVAAGGSHTPGARAVSTEAVIHPPHLPTLAAAARVAFVGAGPGDPGLLTVRARDYLASADVVLLDTAERAEELRSWTRSDVDFVLTEPEGARRLTPAAQVKLLVKTASRYADSSHLVVRLLDGDPTANAGLAGEAVGCRDAGVPFEIVPGVATAWSVPAYAGMPLSGSVGQGGTLHVVDAQDAGCDWSRSTGEDVTVVVLGCGDPLLRALRGLLDAGRDPQTPVALTEHGTTVHQRTSVQRLADTVEALVAGAAACPDASIAVVGHQVELREELSWWESKPLFGWSVLVPRTKDQSGAMTDRIAAYGATSSVVPTISVEPPRTPQQMDRAVKGLVTGRYEWIGFTSVNAVKAVREKFEELGLDARAFAGLKLAAVGGVTAEALREWGLEPDLVPDGEQSARGLLEAWPPYDDVLDPIDRVFLPRADIATDTLVAGLQEMGWAVDDVTAYRTVRASPPPAPVREAIKGGAFDAVCFTSSSTVRNLVGIAGKPHPTTVIACIGPATARTAEEHGLRVDVVAAEPSSTALVDALAQHAREVADQTQAAGEEVLRPSQRRGSARRSRSRR